jgi:hypothetical protein
MEDYLNTVSLPSLPVRLDKVSSCPRLISQLLPEKDLPY